MAARKYRNREEWQALIDQQAQSGLGVTEFCNQFGLTPKYFYRKRRQLRAARALVPTGAAFVEVTSAGPTDTTTGDCLELQYRESRLQMPASTDPTWLAQLLKSL